MNKQTKLQEALGEIRTFLNLYLPHGAKAETARKFKIDRSAITRILAGEISSPVAQDVLDHLLDLAREHKKQQEEMLARLRAKTDDA